MGRSRKLEKVLKNAFISEIMGSAVKMNRGKVVQREISILDFVIEILGKEHNYGIVSMGVEGGSENANRRFERKINAGLILGMSELVKKHTSPDILNHFQHEKKLPFCSKKSILSRAATYIQISNNNL